MTRPRHPLARRQQKDQVKLSEHPICPLCQRPIPPEVRQSLHHLVPKLKGGKGGPVVRLIHKAANLLKAELKRKGVTYAQLVERLADIGISEKEVNVRNKLSRGKFSAAFLLQCLKAIGVDSLQLG